MPRAGRLQFATEDDSVAVEKEWRQESSAGMGEGMSMGARSKSSGTFAAYGGGSGTSCAGDNVQQELAEVEGMNRSKSDFALQRGKSKKEIKTEKTTKFYKDLTNALHDKVADFMVGVSAEEDDDELDTLKRDLTSTLNALQEALMTEVQQREQGERVMQEQCERLTQNRLSELQNIVGKVNEHVQYLENSFGSNVDKLSRDVEALKSSNLAADIERLNNVNQQQAAKIQELERNSNDLVDHVHNILDGHGKLENKLEATFRNYSEELDSKHGHHAAKHEEHTENLSNVQQHLTRIGSEVEDRHANLVKTLEESINDALGKTHAMIVASNKEGAETAKDLATLRSEVDEQHRKVVDGFAPQIEDVRMNLNSLQQELVTVREQDARSMEAALDNLGNNMRELDASVKQQVDEQHRKAIDGFQQEFVAVRERDTRSMQAALDNLGNNMRELDGSMKQQAGKLDKRCSDVSELIDREAAVGERFRTAAQDCFDRMDKRFASLDEACNGQARDFRTLAESSAEMGAGLNQLKSSMCRLANNTANELQANRDEIDQICNSLCNVSKSWGSNIQSRRLSRSMISSESRSTEIRTGGA